MLRVLKSRFVFETPCRTLTVREESLAAISKQLLALVSIPPNAESKSTEPSAIWKRKALSVMLTFSRHALILLLIFGSFAEAQDTARMQQIIESYTQDKQFMGSVLVARGSNVLLSQGYGSANLEWSIPNSPTTRFRLGSITKQFTAACILLLQEQGKLKITEPVKTYMPDAPAAWDKITIHHVLTHTSGIPSFTSFPDYKDFQLKATTPSQLVDRFRNKPLEFEPGSKWNYSNSGYVLLGYLIEKISGQTYQQFLQQNVFDRLGMKDSGYDSNSAIVAHRASGYSPSSRGIVNTGYVNMTVPFSAGSLYSTTEDLLRWEQGLFGGKLLSPESLKQMTTPFKSDYAYGLQVKKVNGLTKIDHGGGIEGFNTELAYWPDEHLTVVALGNLNGPSPNLIADYLAATIHGEKVTLNSERKETKLDRSKLPDYLGEYQLAPKAVLSVMQEGDHLVTQLTGQPKLPIFAESPDRFFLKVVEAQLEFTRDASGKVTKVTLHQGGRDLPAPKIK